LEAKAAELVTKIKGCIGKSIPTSMRKCAVEFQQEAFRLGLLEMAEAAYTLGQQEQRERDAVVAANCGCMAAAATIRKVEDAALNSP